ncbi:hypothetical protein GCM10008983_03600 [Lentibacillus halophilus]|uniref:Restriction endonuclease n=1 Tax=Lentibacillus halophilus TaxID=295065 RepID=A0ABP3IWM6_9BACI
MNIHQAANLIQQDMEMAITNLTVNGSRQNGKGDTFNNGLEAKTSLIRKSTLINYIHEFVKHEMVDNNIRSETIFPPLGQTKPELKVTGMFKQKDQDICAKPTNIGAEKTLVNWGPMVHSNLYCADGPNLSEQILSVNVRSQLSSLAKNTDTLFERMFAEALNLHITYPKMVLGEIYIIPVYEYDETAMKHNRVAFKQSQTDLEKYINFFHFLSGRDDIDEDKHKYERCALVIIDFSRPHAKVYKTTQELKEDGLVRQTYDTELADISTDNFISELIDIHLEDW